MRQVSLGSYSSPFMFPRVTGAEVIGACASTAQRLSSSRNVSGLVLIDPSYLAVTFNGDQPFATYSRTTTTGRLALQSGRINLPYVDSMAHLSRKTANQWVGYVAHELLHIVFTNDGTWSRASRNIDANGKAVNGWFKSKLLNGLEDPRIEACGERIGFAPGAQFCTRALVRDMIERAKQQPIELVCSIRNFPWILAVGLRGYDVGEKEIIAALPKDLARVYKFAKKKYDEAAKHPDFDHPRNGTTLMLRIATAVQRRLKALAQQHEASEPTPINPEPTPGEDRDERDDDEREDDGEGEGEGEDEGEQDGDEDGDESADGSGNDGEGGEGEADGDGNDEDEDGDEGAGEDGAGGYSSESARYEDPDEIRASPNSLPVEPAPQASNDDSAFAMGRDFAVYTLRKTNY